MRMTASEMTAYFRTWEQGTLTQMEEWSELRATDRCFYGRVSPPTTGLCAIETRVGSKGDYEKPLQDHHTTGYNSTIAILDLAKRWGSEKMRAWLRRNVRMNLDILPWFFETFGKPPGENGCIPGLCDWTKEAIVANNYVGDTDIKRHYNAQGLFRALVDPWLMDGTWTYAEVVDLADTHLAWIRGGKGYLIEHPQEVLRYGNDLDTMTGMAHAYMEAGEPTKAVETYQYLNEYCRIIFDESKSVHHAGADGSEWVDWNKGRFIQNSEGKWVHPFAHGYYPYGHQAWYRGHLLSAIQDAIELCDEYADPLALKPFLIDRFVKISRWIDPMERKNAPLAPLTKDAVSWFHNSHLGGGFIGDLSRPMLLQGQTDLTLDEWAAVTDTQMFRRFGSFCDGAGGWCSNGGYWETEYIDDDGDSHPYQHDGGTYRKWECRLPGQENINWYACIDAIRYRGILLGIAELADWARLIAFHYLGYTNTSDNPVSISRRIPSGMRAGMNACGQPARSWQWATQAAYRLRSAEVEV